MTKITGVTPYAVSYPEPNDNNNVRYLTFARVEASDGTVGWGESITQFPASTSATVKLIEGMAEFVVGRDPMTNVAIWRDIKDNSWWYGYKGGVSSFALAALDIALWDLKGKLLNQPVVNLLGGSQRTHLPAIASTHPFHSSLDYEAERHRQYVIEQGFQGVKVGFGKRGDARLGYDLRRDVEFVRLLREAIGQDAMLMVDRGQSLQWSIADAIRRTNAFEEEGLTWIEEPLEPTDIRGFQVLRQHCKTLLASGEREWEIGGFRDLIQTGIVDVVGCDIGRAEGITGAMKVIEAVEANDLWFNSHAWSSAINTAASIAVSATTSRCLVQEFKPEPNPMQHELVHEPLLPIRGMVKVPELPGLGIELQEKVLRKYQV